MTSQKLNEEHEILRSFMAVAISSAFWASLIRLFGGYHGPRNYYMKNLQRIIFM